MAQLEEMLQVYLADDFLGKLRQTLCEMGNENWIAEDPYSLLGIQ